jgi:hypothetical protein
MKDLKNKKHQGSLCEMACVMMLLVSRGMWLLVQQQGDRQGFESGVNIILPAASHCL